MSRTRVTLTALALALIPACGSAPFTASPGSTITLIANPDFVAANGGVSVVTAIVVEPAGTFVPDGVEVFFFTDLGTIEPVGKTNAGVARVNFVSDSRSGTATVTAVSGGTAPAPAPSSTPAAISSAVASGTGTAQVSIKIGSALPHHVVLTANPPAILSNQWSALTANVFDDQGNPVANVPVIFQITGGGESESLDSGGAQVFTDTNGRAFDTLRSRRALTDAGSATVTATTANDVPSNDVTVTIN